MSLVPLPPSRLPAIGIVYSFFPELNGERTYGTAALIGSRVLLTVAHNIYDPAADRGGLKGWADAIDVVLPALSLTRVACENYDITKQWKEKDAASGANGLSMFDYGVLVLPKSAAGLTAPLPVQATKTAGLEGSSLLVAGYPAALPQTVQDLQAGEGFPVFPPPYQNFWDFRLFYRVPTEDGMSGSPVCTMDTSGVLSIRGSHTSRNNFGDGLASAVVITADDEALIRQWLKKYDT